MRLSPEGFNFIRKHESAENKIYKDVAGLDTIGVGHLLTQSELASGKLRISDLPVKYSNGLTDEQVDQLFREDLVSREDAVNRLVEVPLKQNQFDALVSFVFNVGNGAFGSSTLRRFLNRGDYDSVPGQLRRWNRSGGRVVKGLINRREAEIEIWEKGYK